MYKDEGPNYDKNMKAWFASQGKNLLYANIPWRDCEMCKGFPKCEKGGEFHVAHCSFFLPKED